MADGVCLMAQQDLPLLHQQVPREAQHLLVLVRPDLIGCQTTEVIVCLTAEAQPRLRLRPKLSLNLLQLQHLNSKPRLLQRLLHEYF